MPTHPQFWLPPTVAFVISFFTSMIGVSGAVFLLPFQISVLGFTGPAASATNLVFNLVAIPSGVYRYWREGRILWPLAVVIIAGSVPGMFVGALIRTSWLADVRRFQLFVGCVLLWLAVRLGRDVWQSRGQPEQPPGHDQSGAMRLLAFSARELSFEYRGQIHGCNPVSITAMSLAVGVIGGIYGIGGGAMIAPFLVAMYALPVYTIAGAALLGTFVTSAAGAGFYQGIALLSPTAGQTVAPNWWQGVQFGIGGLVGIYFGARSQRFVPPVYLKTALAVVLVGLSVRYLSVLREAGPAPWAVVAAVLVIMVIANWRRKHDRKRDQKSRSVAVH